MAIGTPQSLPFSRRPKDAPSATHMSLSEAAERVSEAMGVSFSTASRHIRTAVAAGQLAEVLVPGNPYNAKARRHYLDRAEFWAWLESTTQ